LLPAWTLNNHDAQRTATKYGRNDIVEMGTFHNGAFRVSSAPVGAALGQRRARAAALLELALPGCVYLYAGEELGLPEVLDIPAAARQDPVFLNSGGDEIGRDGCRVPLPWTAASAGSFGFSDSGSVAAAWMPQPPSWGTWSVESQSADVASTLSLYRAAGVLRQSLPGLKSDDFVWIEGLPADLLAFRRGNVVVACNPTLHTFDLPEDIVGTRTIALSSLVDHVDPTLVPPNTTVWLT
jgi:alpha-glucosidase